MPLLAVRDLEVRYGPIQAVRGVTLSVEQGEIVALLGANGAGKSSLLTACMGLVPPAAGTVEFDGWAAEAEKTETIVRRGMTLTPEGRRVFPYLTVQENLDIGAASRARGKRNPDTREQMFALFPVLKERRDQPAGTLSGGEQQMLAIARSLMSEPRMLLLDEPSLGLAPNIVDQIFDLIAGLRSRGITILLVEQNVELSLDIADRAYVLAGGRIVLQGKPEELRATGRLEGAYLGGA